MIEDYGPSLNFSYNLHGEKYRLPGENFRESTGRIASALSDDTNHYSAFREILLDMRFLPGGRIQAGAGSPKKVTLFNCFVSGTIDDSFTSGENSIMDIAKEAAETMRMGGGIGYDFSTLRPRGAHIRSLNSKSSGPISFMHIFDAVCRCVQSAGHRRGAQMGVLRIDHPDVEEFIHAKQNTTNLTNFNISLAVTDKFMECLYSGKPFPLHFGGKVYKEVDAAALWEMIMRSTWDWAEPGVLFIDEINRTNNLYYCETIAATNPCAEQCLPPYGACLLGSLNLAKYLTVQSVDTYGEATYSLDETQILEDIPHIVRAMDNVNDVSIYPLERQELEAKRKRRVGVGITGTANTLEALGYVYGSPEFCSKLEEIGQNIERACYKASIELAQEKGAFPLFDANAYPKSAHIQESEHLRDLEGSIAKHGIRNSHLTSIAPTGTISMAADYVSSGIEPVFAHEVERIIQDFDTSRIARIKEYGSRELGVKGKLAADVTAEEHLNVLATAQSFVDSSVSKTINMTGKMPWDDFKNIYLLAYEKGCKAVSTFNSDGKRMGILKATDEETPPAEACYFDPETGVRSCDV